METPLILVNFKNEPNAIGANALRLARICEEVAFRQRTNIAIAPAHPDLSHVALRVEIMVLAQGMSPLEGDKHTGHVIPSTLRSIGVGGVILNHSENRLELGQIASCLKLAKAYGLVSVCCASELKEARKIARLGPDAIAYEVPELIGTGRAISMERPESVREFAKMLSRLDPKIVPLCGAGITTHEDVREAFRLGTKGVLVASAITKASDPRGKLIQFARVLR
jgi:triosephosphate isomerase